MSSETQEVTAAQHAERIAVDGYSIVGDAVDPDLVSRLSERIGTLLDDLEIPYGGSSFLGTRTRRLFNLLSRDPLFAEVVLHLSVLPIVEQVLDPGCLLSSLTAIEMQPGQAAQPFHSDDGSIPLPRPHVPVACVAIWALTDFTLDNGATRVVPGSHRFERIAKRGEAPEDVIEAVMPAGSVLVYNGSLWHGGGPNNTRQTRLGIVCNYCAGWLRQEENQLLALPRDQVRTFPPRLQELVGYGVYRGHFGHVDQENPAALVNPDATTDMVWKRMT
jgi:ectoine hydroxylase-related dioxygenase (phytanoyl-CoA dioxygenase family)